MKETFGNIDPSMLADDVGLYSWDVVANNFCGDAEVARLLGFDPAELSAGVPVERLIACLAVEDRRRIARSLHSAITDGTLCRQTYRVPLGRNRYRQVMLVLRCFNYHGGLPTTCSGFVGEVKPRMSKTTVVRGQGNVIHFRPAI